MAEVRPRPRDPSDSWEELEAGRVPGLEDGLARVEAGPELVEASRPRVSTRELVGDILPRDSTQVEDSIQVADSIQVEDSTQVLEVLPPRVNTQEEEEVVEVLPRACLPPALDLPECPSLTSRPRPRVPPGPGPATPRTAATGNIIPSDTTVTGPWRRNRRGLTTTANIPSGW